MVLIILWMLLAFVVIFVLLTAVPSSYIDWMFQQSNQSQSTESGTQ